MQEKNARRKQRRLAKQLSMMRAGRAGTPIPDLAQSESKVNAGSMLTDKNASIIVDLSNYRPFTVNGKGNEPFLVSFSLQLVLLQRHHSAVNTIKLFPNDKKAFTVGCNKS